MRLLWSENHCSFIDHPELELRSRYIYITVVTGPITKPSWQPGRSAHTPYERCVHHVKEMSGRLSIHSLSI